MNRRQFIARSALFTGASISLPALSAFSAQTDLVTTAQTYEFAPSGHFKVTYYGHFAELPVGTVKPEGWIKAWLERQADGLSGHPENMAYPYDTCMYSGKIPPPSVPHGEAWWPCEQSGYFIDGTTRLNHLIDNPKARQIPEASLEYILAHSGQGKLGESVWPWPNTVIGRALLAEYSATANIKIALTLNECLAGSWDFKGRDGFPFEEALYLYGISGNPNLLEHARQSYNQYFKNDPTSFSYVDKIRGNDPLRSHGCTAAEQLKLLPLMYCYTGDPEALELADLAYRKVEGDSLMPDGGIVSSEHLGTTAFNSRHETCDISDWSWSFGYMLLASGDAHWADRIEQMIFNALPGVASKDFKQLQYFSAANQVLCSNTASSTKGQLAGQTYGQARMSYRAAHDTECCAGNVNRAMPNYVTRMWMRMEGGLAATLFGPSEVKAEIDGQPVAITEETEYPFRETISFKIKTPKPVMFPLGLRIPEWCNAASVMVNGEPADAELKAGTFTVLKREFKDGDTVTLTLPMSIQLKEWFDGRAVSVQRGPLVYSVAVDERRVESWHDTEATRSTLNGNNIQGFPALEFFPAGEWRYGIDFDQKNAAAKFKVIESPVRENPFLVSATPVRIEVPLRVLPQWEASWKAVIEPPPANLDLMPQNPASLPDEAQCQATGESKIITLVPYGATHLRLTTLPVIPAGKPA
ncbi:MAG TPA: beta-L-arabinofuranosidase domain-containing protein [Pseudomonadales bacterium]|nr:beta-L-arabinofuranosidase domain-containing protein [Pseudomonadales bacterium]